MVNHSPPLPELCSTILFMLDSKILCRCSSSSGLLYSLPYSLFQDIHSSVYWNAWTVAVSKERIERKQLRRALDPRSFMSLYFLALVYCWAKLSCDHVIFDEYVYHAIFSLLNIIMYYVLHLIITCDTRTALQPAASLMCIHGRLREKAVWQQFNLGPEIALAPAWLMFSVSICLLVVLYNVSSKLVQPLHQRCSLNSSRQDSSLKKASR